MVEEPGSALEPLRDEAYFARVFLEFGAPTWPNGFDISPELLRREMQAAGGTDAGGGGVSPRAQRTALPLIFRRRSFFAPSDLIAAR